MAAPTKSTKINIRVKDNDSDVANDLCEFVVAKATAAIESSGKFTVGLSGGSLAKFLCTGLLDKETDLSKWNMFFCDERHVPLQDSDSTYKVYFEGLVMNGRLGEEQLITINPNLSVENAAEDYLKKIRTVFPGNEIPCFDMLLLGMGPDGHTCSLFPGHPLLQETERLIAPISDSPKPPPCRITMTYPIINNCKYAVFASCGASKAEMVQRVLEGDEDDPLPAARVRPTNGEVFWFLDKAAAAKLKNL